MLLKFIFFKNFTSNENYKVNYKVTVNKIDTYRSNVFGNSLIRNWQRVCLFTFNYHLHVAYVCMKSITFLTTYVLTVSPECYYNPHIDSTCDCCYKFQVSYWPLKKRLLKYFLFYYHKVVKAQLVRRY